MKKLAIFDLDGTLINSIEDLHNSVNYSLKKNGYHLVTLEHTRKSIGNGVAMLMKRSLPNDISQEEYKKALDDFEKDYKLHNQDNTKPFEGMLNVLLTLKKNGFLLAVSTNKLESVAKEIIDNFFPNIFSTVCGDNGIRNKKPSPDSIYEIKKRLDISNSDLIYYIGDSEVDYETAKNAKVNPIIVSYGYRTKDELLSKINDDVIIVDNCNKLVRVSLL